VYYWVGQRQLNILRGGDGITIRSGSRHDYLCAWRCVRCVRCACYVWSTAQRTSRSMNVEALFSILKDFE